MAMPDTATQEDVIMTSKEASKDASKEHGAVNKNDMLEHSEAEAASPIADSVAGEEDPGSALEELVEEQRKDNRRRSD